MSGCCDGSCGESGIPRRQFIKMVGAGAAMIGASGMPVMAGPFDDNDYRRIIPADKKLDPAWVRSLFERGEKQTYANGQLTYIGMPVGGIGAGLVYLGGDGRLWMWDVFNKKYRRGFMGRGADGQTYVKPFEPIQPFAQGFALRIKTGDQTDERSLDRKGFAKVTFDGRYPMGRVTYDDPACAVDVKLDAFSPTIPLDLDNSSYPATVMRYTLTNSSSKQVEATVGGWVDNPVCLYTGRPQDTQRRNALRRGDDVTVITCSAESPRTDHQPAKVQPDILFEDFEKADYTGWSAVGDAFGEGPVAIKDIPDYQGDVRGRGKRVANSHASAPGDDVGEKDSAVGSLLSQSFKIERNYIRFQIGGGSKPHKKKNTLNTLTDEQDLGKVDEEAGLLLLVDGEVVRSATGHNKNQMRTDFMDVAALRGKQAQLMIVDAARRGWGNIGVDQIVFTDSAPKPDAGPIEQRHDYGTFALAAVGGADATNPAAEKDARFADKPADQASAPHGQPLIGALGKTVTLAPGESKTVTFIVAWHFPNLDLDRMGKVGRRYAARFKDAAAVAEHVAANIDTLYDQTRRWVETWYDSTLPYWFLDRTLATVSTLATTVCYLFADGRFYGWEGVNCCPGTCTHVWHYAQSPGRLFPQIERNLRQRVDFGIGQHEDGAISHRTYADKGSHHADDGHCGRILGMYREHQMSADDAFLRSLWPKVKKAIEFMFTRDPDRDGILEGPQPNTLDAAWFGEISFTSSLHLAAMRAGQKMAQEMGDDELAARCRTVADAGAKNILTLYNGEYFYQIEDEKHKDAIGTGTGCYIDQIFGQTWAHWVGLGRLFDRDKQLKALRSLWTYNFVPDVGPFREHFKRGRWYAAAGDAGLIMCSWPRESVDPKKKKHWQYQYFNECMSGFEYQAAAHMVWEGIDQPDLLEKGLAVTRAIHDRYDARLRNPYNEIECSDHYARAMAGYGVFQAACGFNCHGPAGHLEFAPRLTPENFKAPFVTAEGWGTFLQHRARQIMRATLKVRYGKLRLKTIALDPGPNRKPGSVKVVCGGKDVPAKVTVEDRKATVTLNQPITIQADDVLTVQLS